MRITQTRDQLAAIGEKVDEEELVNVAMNGHVIPSLGITKEIMSRGPQVLDME
jgi:hypothetical protein